MAQFEPNLPVFWGHGTADQEIPVEMGTECVGFLREGLGFAEDRWVFVLCFARSAVHSDGVSRVTFKEYTALGHSVNEQEQADLAQWLTTIFT